MQNVNIASAGGDKKTQSCLLLSLDDTLFLWLKMWYSIAQDSPSFPGIIFRNENNKSSNGSIFTAFPNKLAWLQEPTHRSIPYRQIHITGGKAFSKP